MVTEQTRCDKCGGLLLSDGEGGLKCSTCSRPHRTKAETTQFMQTNQKEIGQDAATIGVAATATKWNISAASVYSVVHDLSIYPATPGRQPKLTKSPTREATPPHTTEAGHSTKADHHAAKGNVIEFPDWNQEWPPEVKVAWLNTYAVMENSQSQERIAARKRENDLEIAKLRG